MQHHDIEVMSMGKGSAAVKVRKFGKAGAKPKRAAADAEASPLRMLFARRLREFRERRELTQEELAKKAGLSFHYISLLERGKRNPPLDTMGGLAAALDKVVADFVE